MISVDDLVFRYNCVTYIPIREGKDRTDGKYGVILLDAVIRVVCLHSVAQQ